MWGNGSAERPHLWGSSAGMRLEIKNLIHEPGITIIGKFMERECCDILRWVALG